MAASLDNTRLVETLREVTDQLAAPELTLTEGSRLRARLFAILDTLRAPEPGELGHPKGTERRDGPNGLPAPVSSEASRERVA